jgi:hypothetical protein
VASEPVRSAFPIALDAALESGDPEQVSRLAALLTTLPVGQVPPFLQAQGKRAQALAAGALGEVETVEDNFASAEATFCELGYPYWAARIQLDRADWLAHAGRLQEAAALATQSIATFETVGARPMLARARAILEDIATRSGSEAELQPSS